MGSLLVLHASVGMGAVGEILVVQRSRVVTVLARGLPSPSAGTIAPSPCGCSVAFSEGDSVGPGTPPSTQGVWLVASRGGAPRRLLLPPRSAQGNLLAIGPVAWSPDGTALAYAVNPAGGGMNVSRPEPALGIWLTSYNRVHPRLLVTSVQLGAVDAPPMRAPFEISRLSWSPDGHTLIISTFRRAAGGTALGPITPIILSLNLQSGAIRLLVGGGQDGVVAPRGTALAFTTIGGGAGTAPSSTTLWLADAQGQHRRAIRYGAISSPTWTSDGRSLTYIDAGTTIRTISVATGQQQTVLTISRYTQGLLPAGGQFVGLAWLSPHP